MKKVNYINVQHLENLYYSINGSSKESSKVKNELLKININNNFFLYFIVIMILNFQPIIFQSTCNSLMGTMTIKGVNAERVCSSDSITISRTIIKSLSNQERNITITDVSGLLMVTGFSNILTSTVLTSNHNGVILVSGNTTLTLPNPTNTLGIRYTIKKIDPSSKIVTISGLVDGKNNLQLTEENAYITILSNGNAWYKIAEYVAAKTTEKQTYISNSLGMTFRFIPSGTFVMGSPTDELGRGDNEAQYTVTLSDAYYIQTTELTQGQWESVMGNNPSIYTDCGQNCPVEYITWEDAETFISTINAMGYGSYTLPTEAQWEYAARAGSNKAFANGEILNTTTDSNLDVMGWYNSNSNTKTHAVAQKQANAWGLFDMHGNVNEWCSDIYGNYPTNHVTDPVGPLSGLDHVFRGGSWNFNPGQCRSASRGQSTDGMGIPDRRSTIGMRLLKIIE